MLKKAINIISVVVAISAVTFVFYGLQTHCPRVAIYVYCEESLR